MTRRNNRQQQPRNRNSKRRPRRNPMKDRAVLPPAKTLMGHIMRTVVQTAWDIAQGALSISETHNQFNDTSFMSLSQPLFTPSANGTSYNEWNIDNGWILAQGWLQRFKGLFKEMKVHRITAHYMPYEPITSAGEYIFSMWDKDQDAGPTNFSQCVGNPASVIRKNGQPSRLVWYPTEPEDRNWHQLTDDHIYCSFCIIQAEKAYNVDPAVTPGQTVSPRAQIVGVEGKIIIDVEASFRGKPIEPHVATNCTCRRCIRPLLRNLLSPSKSGSTTPHSEPEIISETEMS